MTPTTDLVGTRGAEPADAPGLTDEDAAGRLIVDGANRLPTPSTPGPVRRVARQLTDPLTALLLGVAAISIIVLSQRVEGAAIAAIVVLNIVIGASQEAKADAAVTALASLVAPTARVWRSGRALTIPAADLVRGDIIDFAAGDRVPADATLLDAASLAVDEAILTGESMPAEKHAGPGPGPEAPLADRGGDAFAGTLVVRGRGMARVTATGPATEVGAIAAALGQPTPPPLVREMRLVARQVGAIAAVLGAALVALVTLGGGSALDGLLAGVALGVAAIPEGLATAVTAALALGARRMATHGAIVRRLPAIEALGAASVICTDKTGTLTTGRLAVADVVSAPSREAQLWDAALRCNDATGGAGDPIDVAIVEAAQAKSKTVPVGRRVAERPFDAETRLMATVHDTGHGAVLSLKGAPEAVLSRCLPGPVRAQLEAEVDRLVGHGLRVLAVAGKAGDDLDAGGLDALGLLAFHDPVRPSAQRAVAESRRAGISVVLVTGDHLDTARAVAAAVGIDTTHATTGAELAAMTPEIRAAAMTSATIVARVDSATKVALIDAHRATGHIVAMTGDGVNDAPALRRADIGVALAGDAGTDVAREAAGIVVTDGDLGTLVAAIAEGRRIYRNIVSVVCYLLAGNLGEILVVMASLVLLPDLVVPLLPVQLLWVNFVTDGPPALALGLDRATGDPLSDPPRLAGERLLSTARQRLLVARAIIVATTVLATGALVSALGWTDAAVRTQLLLSLLAGHLVLAYVVRARRWTFERGWASNRLLLAAVGGSAVIQVAAFGSPPGRSLLGLTVLPPWGWGLAAATAIVSVAGMELVNLVVRRHARRGRS